MSSKLTAQQLAIGYLSIPVNNRPPLLDYCRQALALEEQIPGVIKQLRDEDSAARRRVRDSDENGSF
ncbi:TPA: hypothetical protein G8O67_004914 [Salmonella enterica]|uniref:Uncharacterized protein n=1 Tax=Salmonella enterica TaxID=28901 RepID=A0A756LFQ8_SALER|nr:hypothetical protein [Salmonella enterica]